mmetsp:Transcript_33407/g.83762  ORF Transcript_33407/g.83762 Transcript_33407/m.83762 type:complete len:301 (+) Transcript_33407:392-1294(+)
MLALQSDSAVLGEHRCRAWKGRGWQPSGMHSRSDRPVLGSAARVVAKDIRVVVVVTDLRGLVLLIRGIVGELRRGWHRHRVFRVLHGILLWLGRLLLCGRSVRACLLGARALLTLLAAARVKVQQVVRTFLHTNDGHSVLVPILAIWVGLPVRKLNVGQLCCYLDERKCQLLRRVLQPQGGLDAVVGKVPADLTQVGDLALSQVREGLDLAEEVLGGQVGLEIEADHVQERALGLQDLHFQGPVVVRLFHKQLLDILLPHPFVAGIAGLQDVSQRVGNVGHFEGQENGCRCHRKAVVAEH